MEVGNSSLDGILDERKYSPPDDGGNDEADDDEEESSDDDKALVETVTSPRTQRVKKGPLKRQQCTKCDRNYSKRRYLEKHMWNDHNVVLPKATRGRVPLLPAFEIDPRPYKCDQCIKEYTHLHRLVRHKKVHVLTFCEYCKDSFTYHEDHMRKEHGIELAHPFACEQCGRGFRAKSTYQAHVLLHDEENRTFKCSLCAKAFFHATDLRKHIKTHSNVRSVICEVCGDGFKSAETLKCHMRRHTGDRP